jgi:diguanylate cyclase (GGDEF)-like protein
LGFDTKTLWIALAISNLVFGALMLVHIGHGRERGREWGALRLWASAQVLKGVSIGLIVAKTAFPFPWSYGGNLLYIGGHFVELLAFLSYAGLGHRVRSASLVFTGLLVVYAAGILGRLEINLLAALFTASLAVLYGLSAAALWAAGRRRSRVQSMLVLSNVLIALTALARAGLAWSSSSGAWNPLGGALGNQAMFVLGYMFSLCDGFCFLLLVKEDADRSLLRLATIDQLTGIANRTHFLNLAEDRRRLCQRSGQPITVIMMDVDHFKGINDRFGHAVGDEMLRQVGAVLRAQLRDVDVSGRLGGEEFAVVLPGTSLAAAVPVAERVRAAMATIAVETGHGPAGATVSMGIAELGGDCRLEQAMSEADLRLYRAKAEGRNRVVAVSQTIPDRTRA